MTETTFDSTPVSQPEASAEALADLTDEVDITPLAVETEDSSGGGLPSTAEITAQEPALDASPAPVLSITPPGEQTEALSLPGAAPDLLDAAALDVDPDIELSVSCPEPGLALFELTNVGGDMLTSGSYTLSGSNGRTAPFLLLQGQSVSFPGDGDAVFVAQYLLSSGALVTLQANGQCRVVSTDTPTSTATSTPTHTASLTSTLTPSPTPTHTRTQTRTATPSRTFTPSNTPNGSPTLTPSNTPTRTATSTASNTSTASSTFTPSSTFTATRTPTVTPTPSNTSTPSQTYTPSSTSTPTPTFTATSTPTTTPRNPQLQLTVSCLPSRPNQVIEARFRIRNTGDDMARTGLYTINEPGVLPRTATFQLARNASLTFIAAGNATVDLEYTSINLRYFYLNAFATCIPAPSATPTATQTPTPTATATQTPTPSSTMMPADTPLPATPEPPVVVPPADAPLQPTEIASAAPLPTITATQFQMIVPAATSGNTAPGSDIDETTENGFPIIDTSVIMPDTTVIEREEWTSVDVGRGQCPDWLVYHTDMTGDWEIFRLGALPDSQEGDANLSRGYGRRVFDVMPSRSPDNRWIVFVSNRDGNWELYLSAVDQPMIQRVTVNTTAVDIDPVWSPVSAEIVFESNRDGNWELYHFDTRTGVERRLTTSPGSEVNAFWSHDGEKLVYQSDRDGFWQLYELELATMQERRLSDGQGDDHAPQYSPDDSQLAFRSFRDGDNSVLYTMNADGTNVRGVSDVRGNALNHAWSPDGQLIAYQSDLDGDNDIYVHEVSSGMTRLLTGNLIEDYAPTWVCGSNTLVFTSDVTEDANLFQASALPMNAPPLDVETQTSQLTTAPESDQYPLDAPSEENASRNDSFPSPMKNR